MILGQKIEVTSEKTDLDMGTLEQVAERVTHAIFFSKHVRFRSEHIFLLGSLVLFQFLVFGFVLTVSFRVDTSSRIFKLGHTKVTFGHNDRRIKRHVRSAHHRVFSSFVQHFLEGRGCTRYVPRLA